MLSKQTKAPRKIYAPFTEEQFKKLNEWQQSDFTHPFTCGNDRSDAAHRKTQQRIGGDLGQLVATESGWVCPTCKYTQLWAFDFMTL